MAERTNILWMGEELDFEVSPENKATAQATLQEFLDSAGNPEHQHTVIEPSHNLPRLRERLQAAHEERPFTAAIDLTRGEVFSRLGALSSEMPVWDNFSMSRVRQATKADLTTSGYLLSHNAEEMREACKDFDTSNLLVLDDTSFSGSTSAVFERLMNNAFTDRTIDYTHGFLILNNGDLGPNPGAKARLEASGSKAIGGYDMRTPRDDGWHVFDIVNQPNLTDHLETTLELVRLKQQSDGQQRVNEFLSDETNLRSIYPNHLTRDELVSRQRVGHFLAMQELDGDFHVRNPQLLPAAIEQGHLMQPEQWTRGREETLGLLTRLGKLAS